MVSSTSTRYSRALAVSVLPGLSAPPLPSCFPYSVLILTCTSPLSCCPVNLFLWFILNNGSAVDLPACCPLHLAPPSSALGMTQASQSLDISLQKISLGCFLLNWGVEFEDVNDLLMENSSEAQFCSNPGGSPAPEDMIFSQFYRLSSAR